MKKHMEMLQGLNDPDAISEYIEQVAYDDSITDEEYCELYDYALNKVKSMTNLFG